MKGKVERTEVRDGREFVVVVLPEKKKRPANPRKVGGGKAYARRVKKGRKLGPAVKIRTCRSCGRRQPTSVMLKLGKGEVFLCGECGRKRKEQSMFKKKGA